jgi:APA family basic amino acid/polyamine antiporter
MLKELFALKPLEHFDAASDDLKRALGPWALISLGIGSTIGTGIFILTGLAAAEHAGPAIILAFVLAGVGSAFAGICYAELASMIPVSGSAYSYTYATLGEFLAWCIGWDLMLEYAFSVSTVAVGWSHYAVSLLDTLHLNFLPAALTNAPFNVGSNGVAIITTGAIIDLPAVLICACIAAVLYIGIKQSSFANNIMVITKIAIIILVIGFGAFYIAPANWHPFVPPNTGVWGNFGYSGVLRAAGVIFFAYVGFDAVSTLSQEAKNPQRDMAIGILGSLVVCTLLYIAMSAVLTGMLPYAQLNTAAPVATALNAYPKLLWLSIPVSLGALAGLTSVILVTVLGQTRIFYSMARDGLLPTAFSACHPRFKTPHRSTLMTGIFTASLAGVFPLDILGELVSIGTLLAFILVCIGVLVLRYTRPDAPRPFKVPAPWFTCLAGVFFCGLMAASLPSGTWIRLVVWAALGVIIYFAYGYRHSTLRHGYLKSGHSKHSEKSFLA